ncbi:MAG: anaerobic sulfatase maturase [Clostridiales bacterium]|nr:anaerobic sulfatase maturase [Clostridiales bacterium]
MPPVSVLIKPVSGLCNMNCAYCFYREEIRMRQQQSCEIMSESTLKNTIRKTLLNADIAVHYLFQGGEPTLAGISFYEKVLFYQKHYNKKGILIYNAIQTNGLLIDEEWCRFFHTHQFLVGLSADGTAPIHDSLRKSREGGGTYDAVCRAAQLMEQYHVEYNVLTVVTPPVADQIETIYLQYKNHGWLYQQYIACLDPLEAPREISPWSLSPDIYGDFLIRLFRLWDKDIRDGNAPYIRQFDNYVAIAAGYTPSSCDQCGICGITHAVEADGTVYPCDFYMLDEYQLGNFNHDSFSTIQQKRIDIQFVERSLQISNTCKECRYHWICRGGCQRYRDYNPALSAYENRFCESYKQFFDACLDRILILAENLKNTYMK